MQVWIVYGADDIPETLYEAGTQQVDLESQERIKRFYHRADSCRTLIGRLLPRVMLKQRGVVQPVRFGKTEAGKPYIDINGLSEDVGFNISHDHGLVGMAFQTHTKSDNSSSASKASMIGIDLMQVSLPRYEKTLKGFVESISDTLTPLEYRAIRDPTIDTQEGLRRVFLLWTLKEAYTKAVGQGLGFDFRRIEYNIEGNELRVDSEPLRGWEFVAFTISPQQINQIGEPHYQVVVARFVGDDTPTQVTICNDDEGGKCVLYEVKSFLEQALL